jgi:hypothetical protein
MWEAPMLLRQRVRDRPTTKYYFLGCRLEDLNVIYMVVWHVY